MVPLKTCLFALTLVPAWLISFALSDDPPSPKPEAQKTEVKETDGKSNVRKNDLTDGLMDLLREPAKGRAADDKGTSVPGPADANTSSGQNTKSQPSSTSKAETPLAEVQLGMSTLAQWLRGKPDLTKTKELQRDVVLRLDELIGQLEQQSQSQSASSSTSSTQSTTSSTRQPNQPSQESSSGASQSAASQSGQSGRENSPQNNAGNEPGQQGSDKSTSSDSRQPGPSTGGSSSPSGPGQTGPTANSHGVAVDLNDPRALQRSAWGNLPERTREQMQSRMVERFLPAYREEIEAYYRALVK